MSISYIHERFSEDCILFFPSEGDDMLSMSLCGITFPLRQYKVKRELSALWVFEYVISGRGRYKINNEEYKLQAGDSYIVPLGSNHEYFSDPEDPLHKIWFNVKGSLVLDLIRSYNLEGIVHIPNSGLRKVFSDTFLMLKEHQEDAKEYSTLAVHKIIYNLSKTVHSRLPEIPDDMKELRLIMDREISSGKTFSEIAENFRLSEAQLTRKFKKYFDISPYAYLLSCRLEMAKVLLLNTNDTIREIAHRTGFSDPYYFSNIFKKKFKIAPLYFRRKNS